MQETERSIVAVKVKINTPVERVWKYWTAPEHIVKWNHASDDWHTTRAENDLRPGGGFTYRMEAKDGSTGFDFSGVYDKVVVQKQIDYTMDDGRKVHIVFSSAANSTQIDESFEAENIHSLELQRNGWQSILDTFKNYVHAQET